MTAIVRKNALVVKAAFQALDGTTTQPSAVFCVLNYKSLSGNVQTATLTMTYDNVSKTWSALWDSNVAGRGTVAWVVYGTGTLQAAMEGCFEILANVANNI
jgi:siroheme synthase